MKSFFHAPQREHGAALIIGLIMLLVLTLLGIAAISNVTLQERMAGGLMDRNRAFQAAEIALRRAEDYVTNRNDAPEDVVTGAAIFDVNSGASQPPPNNIEEWEDNYLTAPAISGATSAPRYRIERQIKVSDSQPTTFRLSAIGYGNRPGSVVVLQTSFGVPAF